MKAFAFFAAVFLLASVKADESVNNYIRAILQNLKAQMPSGIPDLQIPILDPLSVPTINERVKEGVADIKILVDGLKIDGMSKFETQKVDADLQNLRLTLSLFIPRVAGNAVYDLDGKIFNIIPLYGKGKASVQIVDLVATGSAALTITGDGHLQATEFDVDPSFGSIFVNLENILGGGNLGQVVNGVVNMLGKTLFDKFKPQIRKELNKAVIGEINKALSKVKLSDIQGGLLPSGYSLNADDIAYEAGNANAFLDQILSNARSTIEKELDPVDLPNGGASFSKRILGIPVHGEAKVTEGWLAGLRTLHRAGDAEMMNAPDGSIIVNAALGLNTLQGHYRASAKFMNIGPETGVTITVSYVSVMLRVKQTFQPGAHPELLDFAISRIDRIDVKFDSGFGPLDFILGTVINLINNLVKDLIVKIVNEPLKKLIGQKLSEITIPIGY